LRDGPPTTVARTGGTKWFLTSVQFLDRIAALLDLPIQEVFDVGDIDRPTSPLSNPDVGRHADQ
jgi:hypothetical protein